VVDKNFDSYDHSFDFASVSCFVVPAGHGGWWENYLRIGPGIRWYPKVSEKYDFLNDLMRRFNLYFEVHHNVVWLGNEPLKDIEETDYRLGFSFSTGGFYKEIKKKMIQ